MSSVVAEQQVRHVAALRRVLETLPRGVEYSRVQRVERVLRMGLGLGVSKRTAANVLGMSIPSLNLWIEKGKIVDALRPGSSRALVEAWSLILVAMEAERAREQGESGDPIAVGIRRLEAAGRLPFEARPNLDAETLRSDFLRSTPAERLRRAADLSFAATHPLASDRA